MAEKRRQPRRRSFTLIELMIVVIILGLLSGIVVPRYMKHLVRAKQQTARTQIGALSQAIGDYHMDMDEYPKDLNALIQSPGSDKWDGPYLKPARIPLDPWGDAYHYDSPGKNSEFDLYSYGKDKAPGGDKENVDITNW